MCERYTYIPTAAEVQSYQDAKLGELAPNYNVAPMQKMPVITTEGFELMKWGLVPSTAKEFKSSFTSINARGETLAEKPIYRTPFKKYRCLVPASGFYGWQQRPTFKQSYYFLSLIHISEPTRRTPISYAVFCLKKKKNG